jgi:sarcosine oxidase
MTSTRYDVIVAGLGAMGSATVAQLALRGKHVLGLERWRPGHQYGSSHGDSRIIREMYFEHPMYVPMVQRAHELWRELEERTGRPLMKINGGLMIGPRDGALVSGTLRSAKEYGLPCEILDADEASKRFPPFTLRDGDVAVHDPRAGYLDPEACNAAFLEAAAESGADLRFEEAILSWRAVDGGVEVKTPAGTHTADRLILSVGAWTPELCEALHLPLAVERQAVFWFDPGPQATQFDPTLFPIWAHEYVPGEICYGFPLLPRGVKASVMHSGEIVSHADDVRRKTTEHDLAALRQALQSVLPGLSQSAVVETDVCLFTNTPDHDFVIDFVPGFPQVLVSSACSGHGFKFASAIGELQADLVMDLPPRYDISPFRMARLARTGR